MVAVEKFQKYPTKPEVVEELQRTTNIGFPIAAMSLMGYFKNMVLVICMGKIGSLELAGGALAIGFTNITGYSVLSGLAMGMEPLCSQAFGSKNFFLAFLALQRTTLILLFSSIPIAFLWFNLEPLMLTIHQNPEITRIASLYCRFAIPDLLANSLLHPLRIFLRSQGTTWPLMWSAFAAIVLHVPITIFLAFSLSLGVKGLAISTFLTNFITLFFLLLYALLFPMPHHEEHQNHSNNLQTPFLSTTRYKKYPLLVAMQPCDNDDSHSTSTSTTIRSNISTTTDSNSTSATTDSSTTGTWRMLIGLSIQSCLAVCLEWWWYELMTISAGYLPNAQTALATSAIVIQTTSLMYTIPTALSASVSTRVGNELGAGRPEKARLATAVGIGLAVVSSLLGLVLTTLGRGPWGRIFTQDGDVLELTMAVLPIIGACELANCPQTTSCGILRGSARPGIGVGINLYSFYLVGAPVAIMLAFVFKMGFVGLCYGLLAAQIACVVLILTVVFKTDWERESVKAKDLVACAVVAKTKTSSASTNCDGFAHADHDLTIKCDLEQATCGVGHLPLLTEN